MLMAINMSAHGRMARRASQGSCTTPMATNSGDHSSYFDTDQDIVMYVLLQYAPIYSFYTCFQIQFLSYKIPLQPFALY